jgi:type IV secretion system protein VirB9
MHYIIKLLFLTTAITIGFKAQAATDPQPLSMDPRVRTMQYQPNEVYTLRGMHGYHTTVQFNEDEVIQNVDLGDSSAWNLSANAHVLTLKPVADHADTNMTVRTDKRLYLFQLTTPTLERDSNGVPIFGKASNAVFLLRFIYPQTTLNLGKPRPAIPTGIISAPTKVQNRFYTARGDNTILPRAVYDDGQFTYFDYSGIQPIPSLYTVGKRRKEYVVNKRMEGEWIVYEGTAKQFTLRHGDQVATVFNDMTVRR